MRSVAPMSVVGILGLLLAASILPALAFSGFLLQRTNDAQQNIVATLAEATAGAAAQTIDHQLDGIFTTLRSLASASTPLRRDDLAPIYKAAVGALSDTSLHLAVIDRDMNQLINTRRPFGADIPKAAQTGPLQRALETGKPQVTDGFVGSVSQKFVFSAILPWTQPGEETLLLAMSQDTESLTDALAMENLRGGWNAAIIDKGGMVLASTLMSSDVGKPFFLGSGADPDAGFQHNVIEGNEKYELITKVSATSGWRVVIWAQTDVVLQPMYRTIRLLLLGGLALISVGTFAAWILGRLITKSVKQLTIDAASLGAGREVPARNLPVLELADVSAVLSDAASQRKASENEIRFLMREVAHRSKNQLAVVASLAKQSAPTANSVAEFSDSFQQRIHGLARSTDLLIAGSVGGVDLGELITVQVAPFQPGDTDSLIVSGPHLRLSSQAAQTLGLVFHELATNAAKYGAFSTPEGRLTVDWKLLDDMLRIDWRETVAGVETARERRGFGSHLIDRTLGRALGAKIERTFHPDGLECIFEIPRLALTQEDKQNV